MSDLVPSVVRNFCLEFLAEPYECYTEHGLHALFFSRLYDALPEDQRYLEWDGRRVCAIQKEYATAHDLGKSRRQHWDIAVLRNPPVTTGMPPYDHFKLDAAVEFGLNEGRDHLLEDMRRLSHPSSNVGTGYAVHLYRISEGLSERDMSPRSTRVWPGNRSDEKDKLLAEVRKTNVTAYYVLVDSTGTHKPEALVFERLGIHQIRP